MGENLSLLLKAQELRDEFRRDPDKLSRHRMDLEITRVMRGLGFKFINTDGQGRALLDDGDPEVTLTVGSYRNACTYLLTMWHLEKIVRQFRRTPDISLGDFLADIADAYQSIERIPF